MVIAPPPTVLTPVPVEETVMEPFSVVMMMLPLCPDAV